MTEPTLEAFLDRLRQSNPFLENRVNGPAPASADVEQIHQAAFERLTSLARQSLEARCGLGAVLWGVAGVGKSHLLARLARWAAADRAHCIYVHNLQSAPEALPRALLRRVVSALTVGRRTGFVSTPLYHLVRAGAVAAAGPSRHGVLQLETLYGLWLDGMHLPLDGRLVFEVLFRFFRSAHLFAIGRDDGTTASLAVRWLSGDTLDPEEGQKLGLPLPRRREDPVALEDAEQIKQVFVALGRLAGSQGRPLILALDQVDNLDEAQFAAATRFLEAILDSAPNLLVVTTGIMDTLRRWYESRVVQSSAWDRITQSEVRLEPLTPVQAEQLLRQRLKDWLAPFLLQPDVAAHVARDPLFPLGQGWSVKTILSSASIRPRDAIRFAGEAWQQQQGRLARVGGAEWLRTWPGDDREPVEVVRLAPEQWLALIDQAVEQEMERLKERWRADPSQLPPSGPELVGALYRLLKSCEGEQAGMGILGVELHQPSRGKYPTYDLTLRRRTNEGEVTMGIVAVVTGDRTSAAGYLRRLVEDLQPPQRVIVLTDEREKLNPAEKGKGYLSQLRGRGANRFEVVEASYADIVEVMALVAVIGRAKSEDIEASPPGGEAEKVTPEEVTASHRRRRRYQASGLLTRVLG